mmetsp:Transcript_80201/g.225112  ORF Transcript_80201/g.225112 Transcript_80201/m.225112 type:complete len:246 (+) Transcript_80201:547-1284(+)
MLQRTAGAPPAPPFASLLRELFLRPSDQCRQGAEHRPPILHRTGQPLRVPLLGPRAAGHARRRLRCSGAQVGGGGRRGAFAASVPRELQPQWLHEGHVGVAAVGADGDPRQGRVGVSCKIGDPLRHGLQQRHQRQVEVPARGLQRQIVGIVPIWHLDLDGHEVHRPEGEDDEERVPHRPRGGQREGARARSSDDAEDHEHHPNVLRELEGHGKVGQLFRLDQILNAGGEVLEDARQNRRIDVDDL